MFSCLRRFARAALGLAKRLLFRQPRGPYEGILFQALEAAHAQLRRDYA
jgi:hypothetical protein